MTQTPAGWFADSHMVDTERYWDGEKWTDRRRPRPSPQQHLAHQPAVMSDRRTNGLEVGLAWVVAVLSIGYMLPWAIAATRGKSNSGAIALLNLLLGWTLIGWVVALVMACGAHQRFSA